MYVTKRQKELLDYLDGYITENGYAPTLEEIGARFNSELARHRPQAPHQPRDEGLIRRTWNHSRAIEMVPQTKVSAAVDLPLLGRVAAGQPIEALEDADHIVGAGAVHPPPEHLRAEGGGQLDGAGRHPRRRFHRRRAAPERRQRRDRRRRRRRRGDGQAVLPRQAGRIRLQPANDAMQPIVVEGEGLRAARRSGGGAAEVFEEDFHRRDAEARSPRVALSVSASLR